MNETELTVALILTSLSLLLVGLILLWLHPAHGVIIPMLPLLLGRR